MTREYDKAHECPRRHKWEIIDGVRDAIKNNLILTIIFFVLFLGENNADIANAVVLFFQSIKISTVFNMILAVSFAIFIGALKAISMTICKFMKHKASHPYKSNIHFYLMSHTIAHIALFGLFTFSLHGIC